ncbi:VOC family protein [Metabacillus sp. 84]|uniref:VOC family protein n=1 Tax=unclassified Metabacillus TaxID=2675274 RepID=UPI003CE7D95B
MKLDHIVHYVQKPAGQAGAEFQLLGFHTVPGGRHEDWGTANSLSYFGLEYIELLSIENQEKAAASDNPLISMCASLKEQGLCQVGIRTEEMEELADLLLHQGLTVSGPFPGSRKREDGSVISWRMLFAGHPESDCSLPFFIEWGTPDQVRKEDLIRTGALAPHPNGIKAIKEVLFFTENPLELASRWSEWFGLEKQSAESGQAKLRLGDQNLLFQQREKHVQPGMYAVSFSERKTKELREKKWLGGTYFV